MDLTVADRAALALRLDGARAGQDRTDDRVADHSAFLREGKKKGNKDVREAADLNISCLSRFVVRTWQLQEKHLS